jgi:transposase InsO family protein
MYELTFEKRAWIVNSYLKGTFSNIDDYIKHYNNKRSHMSLNYKTPKEVWNELKNVNQF